jgi:hypothetical protein
MNFARIPTAYLYETNTCSACGEKRKIVAENQLPKNRVERLCAECCKAAYISEGSPVLNASSLSVALRPALHVVEITRSCVYCETTSGPLVEDGPNTFCCADTKACEARIKTAQPSITQQTPVFEGPIQMGEDVRFPLAAAQGRYLVFGKSGAGKTNTDVTLAEEFLANGAPTGVFDVLGNMWGLRSSADGLQPGFAIPILGGRYGDIPLLSSHGSEVASILARGTSAILDVSLMSHDEQQEFATDFFSDLPRCIEVPIHIIVEEAERVAAARSTSKAHFAASSAASEFSRQCRNEGVGWTFSTQRVDHVAHDILNAASVLVAMQNSDEDEQRSIAAQVASRFGRAKARKILATFANLKRGEAWLLADSAWLGDDDAEAIPLRFRFRLRSTYDSARPRKIGESRPLPSVRADVDLGPFSSLRPPERAVTVTLTDPIEPTPAPIEQPAPEVEQPAAAQPRPDPRREAIRAAGGLTPRRAIILELLRRLPQDHTPRPVLAALTGLNVSSIADAIFTKTLGTLKDEGLVEVRRGRGGGVALTAAGFETFVHSPRPQNRRTSAAPKTPKQHRGR